MSNYRDVYNTRAQDIYSGSNTTEKYKNKVNLYSTLKELEGEEVFFTPNFRDSNEDYKNIFCADTGTIYLNMNDVQKPKTTTKGILSKEPGTIKKIKFYNLYFIEEGDTIDYKQALNNGEDTEITVNSIEDFHYVKNILDDMGFEYEIENKTFIFSKQDFKKAEKILLFIEDENYHIYPLSNELKLNLIKEKIPFEMYSNTIVINNEYCEKVEAVRNKLPSKKSQTETYFEL